MLQKSSKQLCVGFALLLASNSYTTSVEVVSNNFFQPRAFSANLAREMLMEGALTKETNSWYGKFSVDAVYQRSWHQGFTSANDGATEAKQTINGLGVHPFWSGTNVMTLGSNIGSGDLDVYQFGLGGQVNTNGTITLNPLVYQTGADFMLIIGSSPEKSSFFAKIKAPVGVYTINPNLTENPATLTAPYYDAGQIALDDITTYQPAESMTQAFAGHLPGGQASKQGDFMPMQYGLINGQISTGATFGDIEMTAGYRFVSKYDNTFTIALRAAAPTGNTAQGIYMLEPIFGRDGNWGLGGYADGHVNVWQGNNQDNIELKFIANALHLFSAETVRSYDLIANGNGSKYLLVGTFPSGVYQGRIANLINYTTLDSTSMYAIEGDIAVSLAYCTRGWSFDVGYEFWGRSAEHLEIVGNFSNQVYAVLGRQYIETTTTGQVANYCQPLAHINLSASATQQTNPSSDTTIATSQDEVVNAALAGNRVALTQLDIASAQQHASMTSKGFAKITYEWANAQNPAHLGIMGECELSTCNNSALPQWSIAVIAGVSF